MFDPYFNPQPQQLNEVSSVDEVINAQIPRNSTVAFFHRNEDIFFVKSSDERGNCGDPRAFRFSEIDIEELRPVTMTRAEYNELKEMLENAKLIIQQQKQQQTIQPAQAAKTNRKTAEHDADNADA